jgi:hypothetical protein
MMATEAARRADVLARESMHVECIACGWIPVPPEMLVIDRMLRLVEHLAEVHPFYLAYLRVAMRTLDRAVTA